MSKLKSFEFGRCELCQTSPARDLDIGKAPIEYYTAYAQNVLIGGKKYARFWIRCLFASHHKIGRARRVYGWLTQYEMPRWMQPAMVPDDGQRLETPPTPPCPKCRFRPQL